MKILAARSSVAELVAVVVLGTQALAGTFVVDSHGGAGVDFTDLPPAIAAVQPGDVLLVRSGTYSSFTCGQGIAILGYGTPIVSGAAVISAIPVGQRAVVTGLAPTSLVVSSCEGRVVLQQISALTAVTIEDSSDVRLLEVSPDGGSTDQAAMDVVASRVEVVQSALQGGNASGACTETGGSGLQVESASRVHFALSTSRGGNGPSCFTQGVNVGRGGHAISAVDSEVIVAGGGDQLLVGGGGGVNWAELNCYYDGRGGFGVAALNAAVRHSGVRTFGGGFCGSLSVNDPNCYCGRENAFSGSTIARADPADSTLALSGTPAAGQTVTLRLGGAPGSQAVIWMGRHLVLQPEAGIDIELLVDQQRVVTLGTMPPSGSITVHVTIPSSYLPGTLYALQGECRLGSGPIRRSNSIPLVVR